MLGTLTTVPAVDRLDLLADPVAQAIRSRTTHESAHESAQILVAEIDPELADTSAFCARYGVGLEVSANCVVIAGRRGDTTRMAVAVVLATTRADVNGTIRRRLDARRASFAPMHQAVADTGMEYGGITPIGLPEGWPIFVDPKVANTAFVVIGSGLRRSKLVVPGELLGLLPGAEIVEGLAGH